MNENRLHLVRLFAAAGLFLQGIACLMWWALMLTDPGARSLFTWSGETDRMLYGFVWADLLLFSGGSILSAYALSSSKRWTLLVVGLTAGAVWYAELLAVGFSISMGGGWAGAVLMAPSALFMAYTALAAYRLEVSDAFRS